MKNAMIIMGALLLLWSAPAEAQFLKKLTKKLEKKLDKTTEKLENQVDKKIDKMLDLGEEGSQMEEANEDMYPDENGYPDEMMSQDEMGMDAPMGMEDGGNPFASYSKYDFVPGTDLIAYEDFSQENVGDFPSLWNTNASAEIVTLSTVEGNWLRIGQGSGVYVFDGFPETLPEDFTLEFDFLFDYDASEYAFKRYLNLLFSTLEDPNTYMSDFTPTKDYVSISLTNGSGSGRYVALNRASSQKGMAMNSKNPHPFFSKAAPSGAVAHISVLKKGPRLKVYINEDKVIDVPRAFLKDVEMRSLRFQSNISPADQHFFIGNVKFATGVTIPERLFDTGSYQAHGIQFDSGSAQLKPESYGTLKEVAQAIQGYQGVSFMIVGHTDSDGSDAVNLPLSEERAATVKNVLTAEFGIDSSRLETQGAGASQPLSDEATTTAKALNRRVEIKKI